MRVLDLFCGAGGFAYGFLLADRCFEIELAIDYDFRALTTYYSNIPVNQVLCADIKIIHTIEILKHMDHHFPDIVIASPPCESFSVANPRRFKKEYDQLYNDQKGRLLLEAIRIIVDLDPKVFIIENVSQLSSINMRELILHEFSRSNYRKIYFNMLEAEKFCVPSERKRVFISNIKFETSSGTSLITVNQAFKSLSEPSIEILNHETVPVSPRIAKKIPKTPPGGAIVFFKGSRGGTFRNYIRLLENQPSPTVMGKSRFIHPFQSRICTVREHARLMSYPDTFRFHGPMNWQFNQVGESVPPLLSKAIAKQVLLKLTEL
jgi:DNA (cytosine-5)-methyltransferase 1